jgi:hypothetical protein
MPMPAAFKRLDDRVLGRRRQPVGPSDEHVDDHDDDAKPQRPHDGLTTFLAVFYRISRLVFLALALIVTLAIILILAPANDDNVIVRNVFDLAETVAGPFKDVFTVEDDAEREMVVNYVLAAVVYFVAASLVTKLPTFAGKKT